MIQSFTCIFKIVFDYESEVGAARQGFAQSGSCPLDERQSRIRMAKQRVGCAVLEGRSTWTVKLSVYC